MIVIQSLLVLLVCLLGQTSGVLPEDLNVAELPSTRGVVIEGPAGATTQYAGSAVRILGDINKDGIDDYAVGAYHGSFGSRQYCGLTYVMYGCPRISGTVDLGDFSPTKGYKIIGENSNDFSGGVVGSADFNGDGFQDILVTSYLSSPTVNGEWRARAGTTYVVYGRNTNHLPIDDVDLQTMSLTTGLKIYGAAATDYSGYSVNGAGDINHDGYEDILIGASYANRKGRSLCGVVYVLFGKSVFNANIDLAHITSDQGLEIVGAGSIYYTGNAVNSAGDFNKDGVDDFLVGSYLDGPHNEGIVYVIYGKKDGFTANIDLAEFVTSPETGLRIIGEHPGDQLGFSIAGAGDYNGDGVDDIIMGANFVDPLPHTSNGGAAYLIYGHEGGRADDLKISVDMSNEFGFAVYGADTNNNLGYPVSGGDFDNDGYSDLLIGANQQWVDGVFNVGVAYMISGKAGLRSSISTSDWNPEWGFIITGINAGDNLGNNVDVSGDINGDGKNDALITAPHASPNGRTHAGAVYLLYGEDVSETESPTAAPVDSPPPPNPPGMTTDSPSAAPTVASLPDSGSNSPSAAPTTNENNTPTNNTPTNGGDNTPTNNTPTNNTPTNNTPTNNTPTNGGGDNTPTNGNTPSAQGTNAPTNTGDLPTTITTEAPTVVQTSAPSNPIPVPLVPTMIPTATPSEVPSEVPSAAPSTTTPSVVPTASPSATVAPTAQPTAVPTTFTPSRVPTAVPTTSPSAVPTPAPTTVPTAHPTAASTPVTAADGDSQLVFKVIFHIGNISSSEFAIPDQEALLATTAAISNNNLANVEFLGIRDPESPTTGGSSSSNSENTITISANRLRSRRLASNDFVVATRVTFNLHDFPSYHNNASKLYSDAKHNLFSSVETDMFTNEFRDQAQAHGATDAQHAEVTGIEFQDVQIIKPNINSASTAEVGLNQSSLAAVISATIVGFGLLLFMIYMSYTRWCVKDSREVWDEESSSYGSGDDSVISSIAPGADNNNENNNNGGVMVPKNGSRASRSEDRYDLSADEVHETSNFWNDDVMICLSIDHEEQNPDISQLISLPAFTPEDDGTYDSKI
jgi:hypothetical protein